MPPLAPSLQAALAQARQIPGINRDVLAQFQSTSIRTSGDFGIGGIRHANVKFLYRGKELAAQDFLAAKLNTLMALSNPAERITEIHRFANTHEAFLRASMPASAQSTPINQWRQAMGDVVDIDAYEKQIPPQEYIEQVTKAGHFYPEGAISRDPITGKNSYMYSKKSTSQVLPGFAGEDIRKYSTLLGNKVIGRRNPKGGFTYGIDQPSMYSEAMGKVAELQQEMLGYRASAKSQRKIAENLPNAYTHQVQKGLVQYSTDAAVVGDAIYFKGSELANTVIFDEHEMLFNQRHANFLENLKTVPHPEDEIVNLATRHKISLEDAEKIIDLHKSAGPAGQRSKVIASREPGFKARYRWFSPRPADQNAKMVLGFSKGEPYRIMDKNWQSFIQARQTFAGPEGARAALDTEQAALYERIQNQIGYLAAPLAKEEPWRPAYRNFTGAFDYLTDPHYGLSHEAALANARDISFRLTQLKAPVTVTNRGLKWAGTPGEGITAAMQHALESMLPPAMRLSLAEGKVPVGAAFLGDEAYAQMKYAGITHGNITGLAMLGHPNLALNYAKTIAKNPAAAEVKDFLSTMVGAYPMQEYIESWKPNIIGGNQGEPGVLDEELFKAFGQTKLGSNGELEGFTGATLFDPGLNTKAQSAVMHFPQPIKVNIGGEGNKANIKTLHSGLLLSPDAEGLMTGATGLLHGGPLASPKLKLKDAMRTGKQAQIELAYQAYIDAFHIYGGKKGHIARSILENDVLMAEGILHNISPMQEEAYKALYGSQHSGSFVAQPLEMYEKQFGFKWGKEERDAFKQGVGPSRMERAVTHAQNENTFGIFSRNSPEPSTVTIGKTVPMLEAYEGMGKKGIAASMQIVAALKGDYDFDIVTHNVPEGPEAKTFMSIAYDMERSRHQVAGLEELEKLKASQLAPDFFEHSLMQSYAPVQTAEEVAQKIAAKDLGTGMFHSAGMRTFEGALLRGASREEASRLGNIAFDLGKKIIDFKSTSGGNELLKLNYSDILFGGQKHRDQMTELVRMVRPGLNAQDATDAASTILSDISAAQDLVSRRTAIASASNLEELYEATTHQKQLEPGAQGAFAAERQALVTEPGIPPREWASEIGIPINQRSEAPAANASAEALGNANANIAAEAGANTHQGPGVAEPRIATAGERQIPKAAVASEHQASKAAKIAKEAGVNFLEGLSKGRGWGTVAIGAAALAGFGLAMRKPGNITVIADGNRGPVMAPPGTPPARESRVPAIIASRHRIRLPVMTDRQYQVKINMRDVRKQEKGLFASLADMVSSKYNPPASKSQVNFKDDSSDTNYEKIFAHEYRKQMGTG